MEKLKSYGAHGVSYLLSLLAVVAGLDPSLLAAVGGPKALAVAGLAGALATGLHNVMAAGTVKPGVTTVAKMIPLLLVACTAAMLVACATPPTVSEKSGVTVATYLVTGQAIKQKDSDPAVWSRRASYYKAVALQIQDHNNAGTATLATLAADLEPALAQLPPDQRLAAEALITAFTPYLQEQVNANPVVSYSQERLAVILVALIRTCDAYIQSEKQL